MFAVLQIIFIQINELDGHIYSDIKRFYGRFAVWICDEKAKFNLPSCCPHLS